jgi:hypothetical protein
MKKQFIGVGALLAALALTFTATAPAYANGANVVLSHGVGGNTGLATQGSGALVTSVRVAHTEGAVVAGLCGFQSRVTGTLSAGTAYTTIFGYTAGCTVTQFHNDSNINRNFKLGTNIKGQAYHDGAYAPGIATIAIQ